MTEQRTLLSCGEHAVLVELGGLDDVLAFAFAVRGAVTSGTPGFTEVVDIVPAATTVLVVVAEEAEVAALRQGLETLPAPELGEVAANDHVIEIPVRYDGPDLTDVSELTGLSVNDVIAAHSGTDWRVAFGGFAPGFAYLSWGDPRLAVPRRPEPRTSVPSGAVGLAGEFSAIYPRSSPGGWQLIGRTDVVVFDIARDPPALLQPGMAVRFVDVSGADDGR
ncbi:MAG TPA: allophanate hydrolase subunit 1 [Propionibacteriaceae bacterium]|nr:allophanate hydrolase subunit 1 [Propionibacteriaceae bacterium]